MVSKPSPRAARAWVSSLVSSRCTPTDLVSSTELATRLGHDAYEALRLEHFSALRAAVTEHNGVEVKTTGDGLMLSFTSTADAVTCAVAMQQATAKQDGQGRGSGTRDPACPATEIRVGVSSGEATNEDSDLYGPPVVEAARLCAAAAAGQILVSDLVRMLARGKGHTFSSVGELTLKGLPEAVPASEVAWEPIAAAGVPLPPRLTTTQPVAMVGRASEQEVLARAWAQAKDGQRQVVLLSGEPGIGKTRLATETARAAHAEGAVVLLGTCDEDVNLPYQPFVEVLRHYVTHASERHIDVSGDVRGTGEDECGDVTQVRLEERPTAFDLFIRRVVADMTAPDDEDPGLHERRGHAGRLRIVQQDHIEGLDQGEHGLGVMTAYPFVDLAGAVVEGASITFGAVQEVVQAFGDAKERLVPVDRRPAAIDAGAANVAEEGAQHLCDASSRGGRIDVPNDAACQASLGLARRMEPAIGACVTDQGTKTFELSLDRVDFGHSLLLRTPESSRRAPQIRSPLVSLWRTSAGGVPRIPRRTLPPPDSHAHTRCTASLYPSEQPNDATTDLLHHLRRLARQCLNPGPRTPQLRATLAAELHSYGVREAAAGTFHPGHCRSAGWKAATRTGGFGLRTGEHCVLDIASVPVQAGTSQLKCL